MLVWHTIFSEPPHLHQDAIPRNLNSPIEVDVHWIDVHSPTSGTPAIESGKREEARSMSTVDAVWRRAAAEPWGMGMCQINSKLSTLLPLYLIYGSCP